MGLADQKQNNEKSSVKSKEDSSKTPLLKQEKLEEQTISKFTTKKAWERKRTGVYKFEFSTTRQLAGTTFGIVFVLVIIFLCLAALPTAMIVWANKENADNETVSAF